MMKPECSLCLKTMLKLFFDMIVLKVEELVSPVKLGVVVHIHSSHASTCFS